jgi:hypothetical protein
MLLCFCAWKLGYAWFSLSLFLSRQSLGYWCKCCLDRNMPLKVFWLWFSVRFSNKLVCAIRECSKVRWSNWLLFWQFILCGLWSVLWCMELTDPYWYISIFLDKSAILLKQCLICYWNSQIVFLLPLLSWLCGVVWNSNLVLFSLYGESNLNLIIFSHKTFLICVLPLSFSDDKCYQNFILSFTFTISFYRISMFRLYTCVEGER